MLFSDSYSALHLLCSSLTSVKTAEKRKQLHFSAFVDRLQPFFRALQWVIYLYKNRRKTKQAYIGLFLLKAYAVF